MAHIAPVDKEKLGHSALARGLRQAGKSRYAHHRCLGLDGYEVGPHALAEKGRYALLERAGRKLMQGGIVVHDGKCHAGIDQGKALKLVHDVAQLDGVFLEKLAARRHVEKEVFHHEIGTGHTCHRLLALKARLADA